MSPLVSATLARPSRNNENLIDGVVSLISLSAEIVSIPSMNLFLRNLRNSVYRGFVVVIFVIVSMVLSMLTPEAVMAVMSVAVSRNFELIALLSEFIL